MSRFNVNANLFRNAYAWVSKEETRYYLQGVYIQPHPVAGAFLVSTDGHGMVVVYDRTAIVDGAAIVKLTPEALKACKPGARETGERRLISSGDDKPVEVKLEGLTLAVSNAWKIDGTYPDWRRVCPGNLKSDAPVAHFNPTYIARMAKIGEEMESDRKKAARPMTITYNGEGPALIHFNHPDVFGVLMPVRAMRDFDATKKPEWLDQRPEMLVAAE